VRAAGPVAADDPVWLAMREEAAADAAAEPLLSSFLYASVLSHPSFGRALAFVLANRLADATLLATELMAVFEGIMREEPAIERAALADVVAVRERDPACTGFASAFLHFKGYHAIQAQRVAHGLWTRGQRVMARALQSRSAEVFAVDIHPAARIGSGILLDHGTGVVIGETAVVGNHVSLMQNVTLGGTGKDAGDRHPRIGDNVLIGAGATVLGAIDVGKGAQVAAGSLVLKPVAPRTMVAGSPAAVVGVVHGNPAHRMQQWLQTLDSKRAPAWDAALCVDEGDGGGDGGGSGGDKGAPAVKALYEKAVAKAAAAVAPPAPSPPPPRPAAAAAPPAPPRPKPVAPAVPPGRKPGGVPPRPAAKPKGPDPEFFI
jgi:serine O-acetyltransferase